MDSTLIANWNAMVRPADEVWHLGDVAYRNARATVDYLRRLNGRLHLIWDNHDNEETRRLPLWASSQPFAEIVVEGWRLVLCHYALKVWNGVGRGALQLYGHSHGRLPGDRQSCDVGIDNPVWAYRPVALPEIGRHLEILPEHRPVDRHGEAT